MQALEFVNFINDALGYGVVDTIEGTQTDETRKVIRICEAVLKTHSNAGHTPELRERGVLTTTAESDEYAAAVTYGSSTLTSTDTPFTTADVGKAIKVGSDSIYYRIAAFVASGNITLDRAYVGDTDAATTCTVAQDRYTLPTNFSELLSNQMTNLSIGGDIDEVDPTYMRKLKTDLGLGMVTGPPQNFTIHGTNSENTARYLHFDYFPDNIYSFEYEYEKKHPALTTDETEILIPDHLFLAITDAIIARAERDLEQSTTASQRLMEADREMMKSRQSHRNGADIIRFRPGLRTRGQYRRR